MGGSFYQAICKWYCIYIEWYKTQKNQLDADKKFKNHNSYLNIYSQPEAGCKLTSLILINYETYLASEESFCMIVLSETRTSSAETESPLNIIPKFTLVAVKKVALSSA